MKLQYKITLFITIILLIVIGSIGFLSYNQIKNTIETQMGNNAMDLAVTIASMDVIRENLATTKDYQVIQKVIENIRKKTRFQYIIVMDMDGIKYSYPIEYDLGKKYISGGEERVLKKGEAYVSEDKNVLISAIRAFVPIYYNDKQVGAVVVGLLNSKVYSEIKPHILMFWFSLLFGLIIGVIGAYILSHNIKKSTFGLEPKEIALLLGERDNIIQSLKYGVIAINNHGEIILFNKTARHVLKFKEDDLGKNIQEINKEYGDHVFKVLKTKKSIYDQEVKISATKTLLCSHTLLKNYNDDIIGVVSSFQDMSDVKRMAEELTGIKKLTDDLRAQNHEFLNKLHTISGMIQLKEYDEALRYISEISHKRNNILSILSYRIKDAHVAGILLGKYNKAVESKVELIIDPNSYLGEIPSTITADDICSILGNLIENAIEELQGRSDGKIFIRINSSREGLRIEVKDNGYGIDEKIKDKIFQKGITTKNGSRGIGLSIVKKIIDNANGSIEILNDSGTIWNIFIPA